jgi:hypothetical protein
MLAQSEVLFKKLLIRIKEKEPSSAPEKVSSYRKRFRVWPSKTTPKIFGNFFKTTSLTHLQKIRLKT